MQEKEAHNSCKTTFCKEQVAEAALVSNGAVLKWEPIISNSAGSWVPDVWEQARMENDQGSQAYKIAIKESYSPQTVVTVLYEKKDGRLDTDRQKASDGDTPEGHRWYNTIAEAKAACEIHAATGQFPPGVELDESGPKGREY